MTVSVEIDISAKVKKCIPFANIHVFSRKFLS